MSKKTTLSEENGHAVPDEPGTPEPTSGSAVKQMEPIRLAPVRKSWSSPIQAMAKIEALMNDLEPKQQAIVFAWFAATYCPPTNQQALFVPTEGAGR